MFLFYEESGDKKAPAIVFLHGGGIAAWMWKKQLEYFQDYHCIVPHLPDHGNSTGEKLVSIQDCASKVADIIKKVAGGKAHVVGHSLGGKIAVEMLSFCPEVMYSSVVASALFRPVKMMKMTHNMPVYNFTVWLMRFNGIVSYTVKQFQFPDDTYKENCKEDFRKLKADQLFRIYDQVYKNLKLPENLAKATIPVLVIAGAKEPKAMISSVFDVANTLPNARGVLMANTLHTFPWVRYEDFNQIIRDWIEEKPLTGDYIINIKSSNFHEI
jgi:pimeloyl-ACP methyl ester carboxylesterase